MKTPLSKTSFFQSMFAVMRKGAAAESSVPAAVAKPVVRKAPTLSTPPDDPAFATLAASPALRAALRATLKEPSCEGLLDADPDLPISNSPLQIQRLDAKHLLVNVPCWRAAYNTGDGYWVVNDRAPYQPRLVTTSGAGDDVRTIVESHRGRGLGDCFYTTSWGWTGTQFVKTDVSSTLRGSGP